MTRKSDKIPVILDTDIGSDIDDTWALVQLLHCPELDVRLVVSDTGDTACRAALIARMLEIAGRTDIPVGIGMPAPGEPVRQAPWLGRYTPEAYPGILRRDGVAAIIETIEASPEPVTLICIGPVPNIAEALRRAPHIASKSRFAGMLGSIRKNLEGRDGAIAENNVVRDVQACRTVFAAPWLDLTITPLDTCARVRLRGPRYAAIRQNRDPLLRALIENHRIWLGGKPEPDASSILFDTVAVHLAYSTDFLTMETMHLKVTDDGFTVPAPDGNPVRVALAWTDLDGFEDELVHRLTGDAAAAAL
jgi:inosine-uridine nucleoside N-ribohydrolase